MDIRYQVFISSTFADLKEERSKVIQTIMELDCIPAGMEIFPAIDEEQFNFIKRIIDDCDYYILIIGGRYGSVSEDGVSYTEMEYDYAIEKGIKVIAFIHSKPEDIPMGKSEIDQGAREKLEKFKKKVSTGRLIKQWSNAEELPSLVALSLPKTIKTYPAIGWIRANSITNPKLLEELIDQRKEIVQLQIENERITKSFEIDNELLVELDSFVELIGYFKRINEPWTLKITWGEVFFTIAPHLLQPYSDNLLQDLIGNEFSRMVSEAIIYSGTITNNTFQSIKMFLLALKLIDVSTSPESDDKYLCWSLTKKGEFLISNLKSVKKYKIEKLSPPPHQIP